MHGNALEQTPGGETPKWCCCSSTAETSPTRDVGMKLREALKQQLAIIHERVEAKKLAKLALAEVRELLAKEEEQKEMELGRKDIRARVMERVAARLKEEEEKIEKEEMEKALEMLRKEKQPDEKSSETRSVKEGEKKPKRGEEREIREDGGEKKAQEGDKSRVRDKKKPGGRK